jgi:hypothetical protein
MATVGLNSLLHFGTSIGLSDSGSRLVIPDLLLYTTQAAGSDMHTLAPSVGLSPGKTLRSPISTEHLHVRIKSGNEAAGGNAPTLELDGDGCTVSLTNIDKAAQFAKNAEESGFVRIILGIPPSDKTILNLEDFVDYLNQNETQSAKGKAVVSPQVDG